MNFTFSLSAGALCVLVASVVLFIGTTILAWRQGMLDTYGGYAGGLDAVFLVVLYACFWIVPSLLVWAVWATWWKS